MHIHASRPSRRTTRRSLTALGLAVALVAAASCGGDSEAAPTSTTSPPTTARPTTTTAAPTTTQAPTTTAAPTTTEAATTTTIPAPPVYPLTGVLLDDPAATTRPALVVKIDNAPGARPQTGFNAADIVFEEIVNDGLTRFAMVFHSRGSDPVGPVRSGRIQDIDLFGAYNRPLFAWSGGNATVTAAIRASDLIEIGPSRVGGYFRTRDRRAPHNLYATTTALWTNAPLDATQPQQQFAYRSPDEPLAGTPSPGVVINLDNVQAYWAWDPEQGLYVREMEGRPHLDGAGGQVTTNNVVVLNMDYLPGISGSPDAQSVGQGEVFVMTGGNYVHGTWSRADRTQPFQLVADDGSVIELTPGRTFVELPRPGNTLVIPPG